MSNMRIELIEVSVGEITQGYEDNGTEGVVGLSGKLNIRPKYQREFVYNTKQMQAVMDTICKRFPLNTMYWAKNSDGTFEVLDGQQRTLSFCKFKQGEFSILVDNQPLIWDNLTAEEQHRIDDYKLQIYVCEGEEREKLEWFRTVNIAGEKLTEQELRNIAYTGSWLSSAKIYFSKPNCPAYNLARDYISGSPIRQDFLQTAISWINHGDINNYMAECQHDVNANALWFYFQNVINWVKLTFPVYRKEMKHVAWGALYNIHKNDLLDTELLEAKISHLMEDGEIKNKKGIYLYVFSGDEHDLQLRTFDDKVKRETYEKQDGICPICGKKFDLEDMEADHIIPWSKGGKTESNNCQMLCRNCNRRKSNHIK